MAFRRFVGRYGVFMLGLGMLAGSARATTTYCGESSNCGSNNLAAFNAATSALSPVAAVSGFISAGLQSGDLEYIDSATGVEFFGFADSGESQGAATSLSVSGTTLQASFGGLIEVVLPSNTLALELNIGITSSNGTFCIDPAATFNISSNCYEQVFVTSSSDVEFVGAANATAFSTVWTGPTNFSSPTVTLNSFEVFSNQSAQSAVPEGPTNLLIGSGLSALYWLHRRRRQPLPV